MLKKSHNIMWIACIYSERTTNIYSGRAICMHALEKNRMHTLGEKLFACI